MSRFHIWLAMTNYYIMRQFLTPNATATLLQNASFITKCGNYYKLQQLYYKMRQLLQIARVQTNIKEIPYNSNSLQIRGIYCSKSREAKERNIANQKWKTTSKKLMLKKINFIRCFDIVVKFGNKWFNRWPWYLLVKLLVFINIQVKSKTPLHVTAFARSYWF